MRIFRQLISSKKEWLINLTLVIFSVSIPLILGEFFLRYRYGAWPFEKAENFPAYLTKKDTTLKWRFSPGGDRNSLGLRNREITEKSEDVFRILFLGDSLVWTGKTSSGKLYTEVLESNLNALALKDKQIEVINAGIPGYTTYQELEFLKIYGLEMQPDLVVLGVVFNDLFYKYLHKSTDESFLDLEPTSVLNQFDTENFPGILLARSYLTHKLAYFSSKLSRQIQQSPPFPFDDASDFYLAWKDYGWRNSKRLIGEMNDLLQTRNIPLVLVAYPIVNQVEQKYLEIDKDYVLFPQKKIKEISLELQLPLCDLTEPITDQGGTDAFADYLHFNEVGNDIAAEALTDCLVKKETLTRERF